MNISSLVQATPLSNNVGGISRALSTSISSWSGIILATSLTALAGIGFYRWSQAQDQTQEAAPVDPNFERIKERVKKAYAYVFGGLAVTAVSAAVAHAAGLSKHILQNTYFCGPILFIASIGSLAATIFIKKEDVKARQIALAVFNVTMGLTLSPIGFVQRAIVAQAAFITLGIGGLLTFTAYMAPDKRFLKWEGPLMTALTTLSVGSFIARFFPNTAFAYGMDRASLYGGLVIFCGLFMSSTQQLMDQAEKENDAQFDPINASLNLYLDTLNIFVRILRILNENKDKDKA